MARSLAVFLLLCLSAQPVFAYNIDWQGRVQRFSKYTHRESVAQDRRTQALAMQSKNFSRRATNYLRALDEHARPFQAKLTIDNPYK